MNTFHHLLYAATFSNAVSRSRRERRWLMLATIAPDADGAFFWNRDLWEHTHHTLGHNVFFAGALIAIGAFVARRDRRLRLAAETAFCVFVLHYALDLAISGTWPMRPFWPLSGFDINLGNFVTDSTLLDWWLRVPVQWTLVAIAFVLTLLTYRRHGRTALEILSDKLDDLVAGYVARMAKGARCHDCGARAGFRCASCHHAICGTHQELTGLEPFCSSCRDGVPAVS